MKTKKILIKKLKLVECIFWFFCLAFLSHSSILSMFNLHQLTQTLSNKVIFYSNYKTQIQKLNMNERGKLWNWKLHEIFFRKRFLLFVWEAEKSQKPITNRIVNEWILMRVQKKNFHHIAMDMNEAADGHNKWVREKMQYSRWKRPKERHLTFVMKNFLFRSFFLSRK